MFWIGAPGIFLIKHEINFEKNAVELAAEDGGEASE
jgi:hypothetical protein